MFDYDSMTMTYEYDLNMKQDKTLSVSEDYSMIIDIYNNTVYVYTLLNSVLYDYDW